MNELPAVTADPDVEDRRYLVWSNEHNTWWRPARAGYTPNLWHAGRYSEADARDCCGRRSRTGSRPPEVMVLAPEHGHPDGRLTVEQIAAADTLMQQRIGEANNVRRRRRPTVTVDALDGVLS